MTAHVLLQDRKAQPTATLPTLLAMGLGLAVMLGLRTFIPAGDRSPYILPRLLAGLSVAGIGLLAPRVGQDCRDALAERRESSALARHPRSAPQQLQRVLDEACRAPLNAQGLERAVDRILELHRVDPREVPGAHALAAMARLATQAIALPRADTDSDVHEWLNELMVIKSGIGALRTSRGASSRDCQATLRWIGADLARRLTSATANLKPTLARFIAA